MSVRQSKSADFIQLSLDMGPPAEEAPLDELEVLHFDLDRSHRIEIRLRRVAEGWLHGHAYELPLQASTCGPFKAYWRRVYCSRACVLARECDGLIETMERVRERNESKVQVRLAERALAWLRELRAPLPAPCPDPPKKSYQPRGVTREQWAEEREQSQRRWAWNARKAARDAQPCAECGVVRIEHAYQWSPGHARNPAACARFVETEEAATA